MQCHAGGVGKPQAAAKLWCCKAAPACAGPLVLSLVVPDGQPTATLPGPHHRGWDSNKSAVQNIITAHMTGNEQFAADEHSLGFDFGLTMMEMVFLFCQCLLLFLHMLKRMR